MRQRASQRLVEAYSVWYNRSMSPDYGYETLKCNKTPEEIQKIYDDLAFKARLTCEWEIICD